MSLHGMQGPQGKWVELAGIIALSNMLLDSYFLFIIFCLFFICALLPQFLYFGSSFQFWDQADSASLFAKK